MQPSVVVTRGGIVESQHVVRHAVADADGAIVDSNGDIDVPTFLRSSAKPMICTVVVASGAADRFGLSDAELAVAAGSHSGEPYHVEAVMSILEKIGLTPAALQCGIHPPIYEPSAAALFARGERPQAIHNNCSGKHAAILALSLQLGADPATYLAVEHPAQQAILHGCAEMLGMHEAELIVGVDGCGIPVIAVPLRKSAQFFARFARLDRVEPKWREPLERLRRAMTNYPAYVAGTGRFDTDLMRAAYPNIASKGGAEGFFAAAMVERGLGLCMKVADGNYRAASPFAIDRLVHHGALGAEEAQLLESHRRPKVRNHAGKIVGEIHIV
jgi:L-asparaginase II